jgi:hypothetical protein
MTLSSRTILSLAHILVLGPLLLAIGLNYVSANVTLGIGALIIVYHLYKYFATNRGSWVNLFHILVVGPALIAAGAPSPSTQRWPRELVLMLGFAAIGYHGFYLVNASSKLVPL